MSVFTPGKIPAATSNNGANNGLSTEAVNGGKDVALVVDGASTDDQLPTAKAVFDALLSSDGVATGPSNTFNTKIAASVLYNTIGWVSGTTFTIDNWPTPDIIDTDCFTFDGSAVTIQKASRYRVTYSGSVLGDTGAISTNPRLYINGVDSGERPLALSSHGTAAWASGTFTAVLDLNVGDVLTIHCTSVSNGASSRMIASWDIVEEVSGAVSNYTTTEQVIGTFLGDTLYRKVVPMTNKPDGVSSGTNAHGVTDIGIVAEQRVIFNVSGIRLSIDSTGVTGTTDDERCLVTNTDIVWDSPSDRTVATDAYGIIEYTKV